MRLRLKKEVKVVLYTMILVLLIGVLVFEINYSKSKLKQKQVGYSKESSISYITYLKDNSHYEDSSLNNEYNYVASLIDYFNLDFNYSYVLTEKIDYKLSYEVVGNFEIYDSDNKDKPVEKKEYKILDKNSSDGSGQLIKIDLFNQKIDYETYNEIIQGWKKEISPDAVLKITFKVNWNGYSETLDKEISDIYESTFEIPISEKIINIKLPPKTSDRGVLYAKTSFSRGFYIMVGSTGLIILIVMFGIMSNMNKIQKTKSKYEQKIKKILREFDRAITEAKGKFVRKEGEHYIEVNDFMELMDVHDNLNEPIIYYKHGNNRSVFVVRNGSDIYYSVISREEFE